MKRGIYRTLTCERRTDAWERDAAGPGREVTATRGQPVRQTFSQNLILGRGPISNFHVFDCHSLSSDITAVVRMACPSRRSASEADTFPQRNSPLQRRTTPYDRNLLLEYSSNFLRSKVKKVIMPMYHCGFDDPDRARFRRIEAPNERLPGEDPRLDITSNFNRYTFDFTALA